MTLPGGSNPADVLFKLAKGRGLASPTFEQVTSKSFFSLLIYCSIVLFVDVKSESVMKQKIAFNLLFRCMKGDHLMLRHSHGCATGFRYISSSP